MHESGERLTMRWRIPPVIDPRGMRDHGHLTPAHGVPLEIDGWQVKRLGDPLAQEERHRGQGKGHRHHTGCSQGGGIALPRLPGKAVEKVLPVKKTLIGSRGKAEQAEEALRAPPLRPGTGGITRCLSHEEDGIDY